MTTELQKRIDAACASTPPRTTARNKALAQVRWVLQTREGLSVAHGKQIFETVLTTGEGIVFDGRDNEAMKQKYFEGKLGQPLAVVLI